ncbi:MAG: acetyl-CoA C-acetyltransferase, partial [Actinomycetota bacterium]|nr:acetyl-CoA C-acetyltransferase [Actinomycetota bacterium]
MPEAVIVATARTPIGRANKGSLIECRPDDLSALIIDAVLSKLPDLDPSLVEDVIWGCGQPAGEAGTNIGRVAGILAGIDVPGVTVNRYCSSSLQTIRMAAHAIKAGEGDVFISGGVETVSRFMNGAADTGPPNEKFGEAHARTKEREGGGQPTWTPPTGLPDVYIAMGQTAENVREIEGVGRTEMDEFAVRSHRLATEAAQAGRLDAEMIPLELAGALRTSDQTVRPTTTAETLAGLKTVFRPDGGHITAGTSSPISDGAAGVLLASRPAVE